MPNMPGFGEAAELVRGLGLGHHVGLHLTLTEGVPVTEGIRACHRFCDEQGRFRLSRKERVIRLRDGERKALQEEVEGQIARCRRHGIALTHLDSHSHAHEEWAIASVIIETAREMAIPYVRLCKNFGSGMSPAKQLYRHIVNARFRKARLAATRYFGLPQDYTLFCQRSQGQNAKEASWEIMVHPVVDGAQQLLDGWLHQPLAATLQDVPEHERAVSYSRYRYRSGLNAGEAAATESGTTGVCRK
jgi:predicted glycoside hydrolase/deacetylase ChbG (UPF0249 family)